MREGYSCSKKNPIVSRQGFLQAYLEPHMVNSDKTKNKFRSGSSLPKVDFFNRDIILNLGNLTEIVSDPLVLTVCYSDTTLVYGHPHALTYYHELFGGPSSFTFWVCNNHIALMTGTSSL